MTYWIVAAVLTVILVAWLTKGSKRDKVIAAMEAAIVDGDEEMLSRLLKESPAVAENVNDVTFLLVKTVCHNRGSMVQELLDLGHSGRDIQLCALAHEVDVLSSAIKDADADVLRVLMVAGMEAEAEFASPMLCCYVLGRPEHLRVLKMFDALSATEEQNERKFTCLHAVALCFEDNAEVLLQMAEEALKNGADVNALSAAGNTPLDFAMDSTHVGAGDRTALQELLLRYGAKTGRSLRIPNPSYEAVAYFSDKSPDLVALVLPDGVQVLGVDSPDAEPLPVDNLAEKSAKNPELAQIAAHRAHVRVSVQGAGGEDPLVVVKRMLGVLMQVAALPGCAGVRHGGALVPVSCCVVDAEAPDLFYPLLYTDVMTGLTGDKVYAVDTVSLTAYGLPEVELLVEEKLLKKKGCHIQELVYLLLTELVSGASVWEDGHTVTLKNLFCLIASGKHLVTEKQGLVFVASMKTN